MPFRIVSTVPRRRLCVWPPRGGPACSRLADVPSRSVPSSVLLRRTCLAVRFVFSSPGRGDRESEFPAFDRPLRGRCSIAEAEQSRIGLRCLEVRNSPRGNVALRKIHRTATAYPKSVGYFKMKNERGFGVRLDAKTTCGCLFFLLVPKLCLGTHFPEAPASRRRVKLGMKKWQPAERLPFWRFLGWTPKKSLLF
jgi:hypothetical protein